MKVDKSKSRREYNSAFGGIVDLIDVELYDSFNFQCQRCGECCHDPPGLNPKEVIKLAEYLGVTKPQFFGRYTSIHKDSYYGWKVKLKKTNDYCIFLKIDGKSSCSVYEVRPRQCRGRPIIGTVNLLDKIVDVEWMSFQINPCAGLDKGNECTVAEWIKENNLEELWQDEQDYRRLVVPMKSRMSSKKLMKNIRDLFIK